MIENKEVVKKLVEYFLTQKPEIVARLLANTMIDLHRFNNIDQLEEAEKNNLLFRISMNSKELINFSEYGPTYDLIIVNIEYKDSIDE